MKFDASRTSRSRNNDKHSQGRLFLLIPLFLTVMQTSHVLLILIFLTFFFDRAKKK